MFEAACIYLLQRVLYKKYWNKMISTSQRSEVVRVFERVSLHACGSFWILPLHGWNRKCSSNPQEMRKIFLVFT
ncbi:hypothetical protein C823_006037 [Eubacterium plexicaudatum ASF492]|nr:hypothetical protein C823_006037 [Eubacterium plexicaudatum ASF492]